MGMPGGASLNRGMVAAVLAAAVVCWGPGRLAPSARAQESTTGPASLDLDHGLQGRRFTGAMTVGEQPEVIEETLVFSDGRFSSAVCRQYGFPPAPYWVRRDADGLHFFAELSNPDNGTIRFEGVFDGQRMRATAVWTKERWYWTLEQTFRFTSRDAGRSE